MLTLDEKKSIIEKYGRDKQAAFKEMAKDYGDSFLFYYIYGFSGVKEWENIQ